MIPLAAASATTGPSPQSSRRRTLKQPSVAVSGPGIHTGVEATVTLFPAAAGDGIVFQNADAAQEIRAAASNVTETARCTVLSGKSPAGILCVATVEHLLSALAAAGITDARIEITGPEVPILDGSAAPWCQVIAQTQTEDLVAELPPARTLAGPLVLSGKDGAFIAAFPAASCRYTVAITFAHPLVQTQVARWEAVSSDDFAESVAPARTFGFIEEVEKLRAAGLARGGSLDNALVIYPDRYSAPLRFPDELARHKLLDLIGDLMLANVPNLRADIVAVRPSHLLNTQFAARLAQAEWTERFEQTD